MKRRRKATRRRASWVKNDEWISEHFEELVDKYGGQYVIVSGGEVFIGGDVRRLEAKARRKYPCLTPIGMPVPRPQDFQCAL